MFVVLLFGDPELMKGAQAGEDAAAEPGRVSAFGGVAWRMDLDFLVGSANAEFVAETIRETGDERASADQDDVAKQRRSGVYIDSIDG